MTDTPQPVAGSLEARIIRACPVHTGCALECSERKVEELGTIATFDVREDNWRKKFRGWMQQFSQGDKS
jgi:hypothetical protein